MDLVELVVALAVFVVFFNKRVLAEVVLVDGVVVL